MKFVMMIVLDPDHSAEDEANAPDMDEWFDYARERGEYDLGVRLEERETAHTVRVRDGKLLVTDGPFAETKETLAGFALLSARPSRMRWNLRGGTPRVTSAGLSCGLSTRSAVRSWAPSPARP